MTIPSPSPARADLARLTEQRILGAAAALVTGGAEDFTFEALSRASGVPQRTIYRYYPSKAALQDAFWTWLNAEMAVPASPKDPDELVRYGHRLFAAFDRQAELVRAMLRSPAGCAIRAEQAPAREAKFRTALAPVLDRLPPDEQRALLAAAEAVCSASGWESMRAGGGAAGVEWALAALIEHARRRATPAPRPEENPK